MNKYLPFQNRLKYINSDFIGAISAFLCIIHCAIVPILMAIHSFYYTSTVITSHSHQEHSHSFNINTIFEGSHWHALDYFFILITLIAVYFATRKSVFLWISIGLWAAASIFVAAVLLEEYINGIEYLAYLASATLIVFHFLNQYFDRKNKSNIVTINQIKKNEPNLETNSFDGVALETDIQSNKTNRVSCIC